MTDERNTTPSAAVAGGDAGSLTSAVRESSPSASGSPVALDDGWYVPCKEGEHAFCPQGHIDGHADCECPCHGGWDRGHRAGYELGRYDEKHGQDNAYWLSRASSGPTAEGTLEQQQAANKVTSDNARRHGATVKLPYPLAGLPSAGDAEAERGPVSTWHYHRVPGLGGIGHGHPGGRESHEHEDVLQPPKASSDVPHAPQSPVDICSVCGRYRRAHEGGWCDRKARTSRFTKDVVTARPANDRDLDWVDTLDRDHVQPMLLDQSECDECGTGAGLDDADTTMWWFHTADCTVGQRHVLITEIHRLRSAASAGDESWKATVQAWEDGMRPDDDAGMRLLGRMVDWAERGDGTNWNRYRQDLEAAREMLDDWREDWRSAASNTVPTEGQS